MLVGREIMPVLGVRAAQLLMGVEAEMHLQNDPETTVHPEGHVLLLEFCHLHNWEASLVHYPVYLVFVEALCY